MIDNNTEQNNNQPIKDQTLDTDKHTIVTTKDWLPSIDKSTNTIVDNIMDSDDPEDIKQLISSFNLNQSKKNILRILKLNNLLDLVTEETLKRYQKHPDEISNKELMDCMTIVSEQIAQSQSIVNSVTAIPAIQINQQKNEVNVNVSPTLTKDERENVINAVMQIIKKAQTDQQPKQQEGNTKVSVVTPTLPEINKTSTKGENK
jgi:hypothetical protein